MAKRIRSILLVEDSIKYYSTYLPALYNMVLQQNTKSIRDALNEQQPISICIDGKTGRAYMKA